MILTSDVYVPALRWRQGEYQALVGLTEPIKARIVPFITIPEIEFDFEEWRPKKSVHEHVYPFPTRYQKKWGSRPAWIDVHSSIVDKPMDDGRDILTYVFDALRKFKGNAAIPALPLGAATQAIQSAAAVIKYDNKGIAISVRIEDIMKPDARKRIEALVATLGVPLNATDLVIDLGAPNFEPYQEFVGALIVALQKLGNLSDFRNFVLIGTAFPKTLKEVEKGVDEIPRHDWMFYRALVSKLPKNLRRPNFADYTIVHPEFAPIDMRKIKSAGKVIYTTGGSWFISKGGAFRDDPAQMHGHCQAVIKAGIFQGSTYSAGDKYIAGCAAGSEKPSNQSRWKFVAINHHITQVLNDLATLNAAS